ncbi:MAG: hypothetical protein ACYTFY_05500 [Planctomycetota bacterium]|jgi:hypothetical protein
MKRFLAILSLAAVVFCSLTFKASADLKEIEPGVFYEDFKGGEDSVFGEGPNKLNRDIKAKGNRKPKVLELKSGLRLEGNFHSRVFYDRPLKDFVFETTVRKTKGTYAGIVVRDHWRIYFQMRGYLCLNSDLPGLVGGQLFKSGKTFTGYHKLKVVCAGPNLRAYVDGTEIFSYIIPDKPGKCGIYSHKGEAYYKDIRITEKVSPEYFMNMAPAAENDELVFAPAEDFNLLFKLGNASGVAQKVTLKVSINDWEEKVIVPEQEKTLTIEKDTIVKVPFKGMKQGFYRISCAADTEGKVITVIDDLPLAIQERGNNKEVPAPKLMMGVYSKYFNKITPVYINTYSHGIARILRENGFNTILADSNFKKPIIDIYRSYGIATVARAGAFLDMPGVIATLADDEPKPEDIPRLKEQYKGLREKYGKKVSTCMIGEGMGLGGGHDPITIWQQLEAEVRTFRWYGIKKTYYGLLRGTAYKGWPTLPAVMRVTEGSADSEWWFVPPSFGDNKHEGYYKNPTPAEMKGLMHMAVAHGAKGQLLFCLQDFQKWPGLIKDKSLLPTDGKLAAAKEANDIFNRHAELLTSLKYGNFKINNSDWIRMEVVPRIEKNGKTYIYAFNKDKDNTVTADISFSAKGKQTVKDIFAGKSYSSTPAEGGMQSVKITLKPCDAALLQVDTVTTAADKITQPAGSEKLEAALSAQIMNEVMKEGVALVSTKISEQPCLPGDRIGFWLQDDPRHVWLKNNSNPRCFSWSGGLWPRTDKGYLSLSSALLYAAIEKMKDELKDEDAALAKSPFWTIFPKAHQQNLSPVELRAMLHTALAYGSKAVVLNSSLPAELKKTVQDVKASTAAGRKELAGLMVGGLDGRCFNPEVAVIPLKSKDKKLYAYMINLNLKESVTTELMLWKETWRWNKAKDLYSGTELKVSESEEEGYRSCQVSFEPGQGRLIAGDAAIVSRKEQQAKRRKLKGEYSKARGAYFQARSKVLSKARNADQECKALWEDFQKATAELNGFIDSYSYVKEEFKKYEEAAGKEGVSAKEKKKLFTNYRKKRFHLYSAKLRSDKKWKKENDALQKKIAEEEKKLDLWLCDKYPELLPLYKVYQEKKKAAGE